MAVTGPTAQNFPDAFVGKVTLSAYEPFPIVSSTVYSSDAPASIQFIPWVQPGPVGLRNIIFPVSMNAVVPTATSQASTGSEGYSYGFTANIYSRQDYGANSTNLVTYATGSGGLTASLGYSSTSQSFVIKWATDGSGGTSQFTTTSADGNWSSFATGPKFLSHPLQPDLPERRRILAGGAAQLDHRHEQQQRHPALVQQALAAMAGGQYRQLRRQRDDRLQRSRGDGHRRGERDHNQHHHAGERDQRLDAAARLLRDQQRLSEMLKWLACKLIDRADLVHARSAVGWEVGNQRRASRRVAPYGGLDCRMEARPRSASLSAA
jgi:hypothetical protein